MLRLQGFYEGIEVTEVDSGTASAPDKNWVKGTDVSEKGTRILHEICLQRYLLETINEDLWK